MNTFTRSQRRKPKIFEPERSEAELDDLKRRLAEFGYKWLIFSTEKEYAALADKTGWEFIRVGFIGNAKRWWRWMRTHERSRAHSHYRNCMIEASVEVLREEERRIRHLIKSVENALAEK